MKKIYGLILIVSAVFLLLAFPISAAEQVGVSKDRFSCDAISSSSADLSLGGEGTVAISFRNGAPALEMDGVDFSNSKTENALRLVLENKSACGSFSLFYTVSGLEKEVRVSIDRRSEKKEYFVYISNLPSISDMRMTFSGAYSGAIELISIGAVSLYNDSEEQPGEILECLYDPQKNSISVDGTVEHDIAVRIREATLALYVFDADEAVAPAKINRSSPVATTSLSMRFEFKLENVSFAQRFSQYVVAIVSAEGKVLYMYSPKRACISPAEEGGAKIPFKGLYTEHSVLASYADAEFVVVDIYLDRLQCKENSGYLYMLDEQRYYIDRKYIAEVDEAIKQYKAAGASVYLRFLLDDGGEYSELCSTVPSAAGVTHYGISLRGEESRKTLYSFVDFLCSRYASPKDGCVKGIILGRSVDNSKQFNYVGDFPLDSYSSVYGMALYVVSQAANADGRSLDLVVPVSDRYDNGVRDLAAGEYVPSLFLTSLCKMLKQNFGNGLSVRVMLETSAMPSELAKVSEGKRVSAENIYELESLLTSLSREYGVVKTGYFYYWAPIEDADIRALNSAYVYTYYKLFAENASGFILSTENLKTSRETAVLFSTAKYIDSQLGVDKNGDVLVDFDQSDWAAFIPGLRLDRLPRRTILSQKEYSTPSSLITGSYTLWGENQGRGTYEWYAGPGSELTLREDEEQRRILTAVVAPQEEQLGFSKLVYSFSFEEIINVVDMLSVDICVEGEKGSRYRLAIEVCGEQASGEVLAEVESGVPTTVYLSTAALDDGDSVKSLRIISVPLGEETPYEVQVKKLALHSSQLNGEELEQKITDWRREQLERIEKEKAQAGVSLQSGMVLVALLLCVSVIIVVAVARKKD